MRRVALVLILGLFGCSCGDDEVSLTSLALSPEVLRLGGLESAQLSATASFDDGSARDVTAGVTWRSSDEAIAVVVAQGPSGGQVTGISAGHSSISAELLGQRAEAGVDVAVERIEALSLDPDRFEVLVGGARKLSLLAIYDDGSIRDVAERATWSSDDDTVATAANGTVSGVALGRTTIHAAYSGFVASASAEATLNRAETSPSNGEVGVAVSRETELHFLAPLAASVTPAGDDVYAEFGGQRLRTRLHLSRDRRTLKVFYPDYLPPSARVVVTVVGDALLDERARALDADEDGVAGGTRQFTFDTLSLSLVPGTAVIGRVFASELAPGAGGATVNTALAGVIVTVEGIPASQLSATTDALGNFRLEPAPAGRFFALIEGRAAQATPAGAYYPHVAKPWVSVPGQVISVGEVYLPKIAAGTLQVVSGSADTRVEPPADVVADHPELAGVFVNVPPGALYADDGVVGGAVGISPVPADRLPSRLPGMLPFPLVITIQTDGAANFDAPVPVCFPNLPEPLSGRTKLPGERSSLFSFNHDTGEYEVVGPLEVNTDGTLVCSVDGTGVLAPGWHGEAPANGAEPEPDPPPAPSKKPCGDDVKTPTFWKTLKVLADCVKGFDKLSKALKSVFDLIKQIGQVKAALEVVIAGVQSGADSLELVKANLNLVDQIKKVGQKKLADFNDVASPIANISQGVKCAGGVLELLTTPCESILACPNDYSGALVLACGFVTEFSKVVSYANTALDTINNLITSAPFAPICLGIDFAKRTIDEKLKLQKMMMGQGLESDGSELRLAQSDPELMAALTMVRDNLAFADDLAAGELEPLIDGVDEILSYGGRAHYQYRGVARGSYVMVSQDDNIQRTEADAAGHFRFFLRPVARTTVAILDRPTLSCGALTLETSGPGNTTFLPPIALGDCTGGDADGDELTDEAEAIVGTSPTNADTDEDGVMDGPEVRALTNPLDGINTLTGIVASVRTPGEAVDVCTSGGLVAVALAGGGVSIFNAYAGMDPIIVAQVPSPPSTRVSCSPFRVALGRPDGITVISFTTTSPIPESRDYTITGAHGAVAIAGNEAFIAKDNGIAAVDLATGATSVDNILGEAVDDIVYARGLIYALGDSLHVLDPRTLTEIDSVNAQTATPPPAGRRLFIGQREAFAVHQNGYTSFDLVDPTQPVLRAGGDTNVTGWRDIAANGSGLAVAVNGPNQGGPIGLSIYDVGDPTVVDALIFGIELPENGTGVAIERGLAYASAGASGLVVASYSSADVLGRAPRISIAASSGPNVVAGATFSVTASVGDDVEVRSVELYRHGQLVYADGSYPFEVDLVAPTQTASVVVLRARAFDTGGNATWSAPLQLTTTLDDTGPSVVAVQMLRVAPRVVRAAFNEAIDPATVTAASFIVEEAGTDQMFDTSDDTAVSGGSSFEANDFVAQMIFPSALPPGIYRVTLGADIADRAGNRLGSDYQQTFCQVAACETTPVRLVSNLSGQTPGQQCFVGGISADGSAVAFASADPALVPNDLNVNFDAFVVPYPALVIERVSVDMAGVEANGRTDFATISDDGAFSAFSTTATNLLPSVGVRAVYLRNQATHALTAVSVDNAGTLGGGFFYRVALSATGRWVVFEATATNLDPADIQTDQDIYLRDTMANTTEVVSVADDESHIFADKERPAISADGNRVLWFQRDNDSLQIRDRASGTTTRVDVDELGAPVVVFNRQFKMTANGRWLAYTTDTDIYVHDLDTGTVTRDVTGTNLGYPSVSGDGSRLVYYSNGDLLSYRRGPQTTAPLLTASNIHDPVITSDGSAVVFEANLNNTASATFPYRMLLPP